MEKKFDSLKRGIKRSFGRKVAEDVALDLKKVGDAKGRPTQRDPGEEAQQQQEQQKQRQDVRDIEAEAKAKAEAEVEDLPADVTTKKKEKKKDGTWKGLKRSLGRRLGRRVEDEIQIAGENRMQEGQQQEQQESQEEDPQVEPTTTTALPPARYRVRRTRTAGPEACSRLPIRTPIRTTGAAQPNNDVLRSSATALATAHPSSALHNADHAAVHIAHDLGTTPTTPGYPHSLEVAHPVPRARRKFATWSPRKRPFWCCREDNDNVGTGVLSNKSSKSGLPALGDEDRRSSEPDGDMAEWRTCDAGAARAGDGFTWPCSADPGFLEATVFTPVERGNAEHRSVDGAGEERTEDKGAGTLSPEQCSSNEPRGDNRDTPARAQGDASVLGYEHGQEGDEHRLAGAPFNGRGPPLDEKLRQIRARIACIQQAISSGVEERALEAIEEEKEDERVEGSEQESAPVRILRQITQHAARSARESQDQAGRQLAMPDQPEDFQADTHPFSSRAPEPGEWLRSKLSDVDKRDHGLAHRQLYLGETCGESSKASSLGPPACVPTMYLLPARLRDTASGEDPPREQSEARAMKVRNWFAAWETRKAAKDAVDGPSAWEGDTSSTSSAQLMRNEPVSEGLRGSSASAVCRDVSDAGSHIPRPVFGTRLRVRSRQHIARETSIVVDGWTCPTRLQDASQTRPRTERAQVEDEQAGNEMFGSVDEADEGGEDVQAEPTDQDERQWNRS
jgi:hypothetical protein